VSGPELPPAERSERRASWWQRAAGILAGEQRGIALPLVGVALGLVIAGAGVFRDAPEPLKEVPPGYAALVNQKGVLMSDLINEVRNKTTQDYEAATPEEVRGILRDMINEELLVQRALTLDLPETTIEVREAMSLGVEAQVAEPYWTVPPTDEQLRDFYMTTRADYTSDGSMVVHDIVMRVGGFQNANQSTAQGMADAAEAVYRLRSGASLDYVTEHYGFVSSGRSDGTELFDFVAKLNLGDQLYGIASTMGNGEISDPILADDGIHVLVMDQRRPPSMDDFANVRDKVYQAYRRMQQERATAENIELLRGQAEIILAPGQSE
jgi:hypothetical protein